MPATASILFVNKTVGSTQLSQSRGSEKSRIFSHVQRSAYNRLPDASKGAEVLYQSPEEWNIQGETICKSISKLTLVKKRLPDRTRRDAATPHPSRPRVTDSMPMDRFATPSADPFDCLEASTSPYMQHLLKFYSSDVVPRVFPIKSLAIASREYTLAYVHEDPLLRDALMCTTSAGIYFHCGDLNHGIEAMSLKVKVLNTLQRTLSKARDSKARFSSLYAVSLLLWIECLSGNTADLKAHSAGLEQLASRAGDIRAKPLCVLSSLLTCSYLCSALLDAPPNLAPVKIFQEEMLSSTAWLILDSLDKNTNKGLGHRLFTPSVTKLMGSDLTKLAKSQRDVMVLKDWCVHNEVESTFSDVEYLYAKDAYVQYSLVQLPCYMTLTPAQNAIRLVLFVFPQPIILVTRPSTAFCRTMSTRLRGYVECSDLTDLWAPNCELLVWMLFIGAHISYQEAEWAWFHARLSTVFTFLGLQSMTEVETVLDGFYYLPQFLRCTVQAIWDQYKQS